MTHTVAERMKAIGNKGDRPLKQSATVALVTSYIEMDEHPQRLRLISTSS